MTQGALGHTGAQGRAKGFQQVVANYPGCEGDRRRARRLGRDQGRAHLGFAADAESPTSPAPSSTMTTWRLPRINVMKSKGREGIIIGGVDAMPPAVQRGARRHHAGNRPQPILPYPWLVGGRRRRRSSAGGEKAGEGGISELHPGRRTGHHQGNSTRSSVAAEELPDLTADPLAEDTIIKARTTRARPVCFRSGDAPARDDRGLEIIRRRRGAARRGFHAAWPARSTVSSAKTGPANPR